MGRVKRSLRLCLFILILCIILTIIVYESLTRMSQFNYYSKVRSYVSKPFSDGAKTILLWTGFFGSRNWELPANTVKQSFFENLKCPVTNCVITTDNKYLESITQYDAVLFHTAEPFSFLKNSIPPERSQRQLYVFAIQESPAHTKHDLSDEHNFYNLSMTYRLDSDIAWPYGHIEDIATGEIVAPNISPKWRKPLNEFQLNTIDETMINGKTKIVAWFVSHCGTISKRDELAEALQKYIQVDIYGKCGNLSCPRFSTQCDDILDHQYKFYLSFENSLCIDYVTEKFFNTLKQNIVPVVYGGADYNRFAPPHSYINVDDFETVEELGNYLMYLDKNPKEYKKYFWWKQFYRVTEDSQFCKLCEKLNNPASREKIQYYRNIQEWWYGHSCQLEPNIKFD